jgi:alpha-galactosidase
MSLSKYGLIRPKSDNWEAGISRDQPNAVYEIGLFSLHYDLIERDDRRELRFFVLPLDLAGACRPRRGRISTHPTLPIGEAHASSGDMYGDHCIQIALRGSPINGGFGSGRTMRNGQDVAALSFIRQLLAEVGDYLWVETVFSHPSGLNLTHRVIGCRSWSGVLVETVVEHGGSEPVVVEHLSSFVLGGLSPLADDDMPDRLELRRVRTFWSAEGRIVSEAFEDLHLERSWTGHAVNNLRYGEVGSMPVRQFFPIIGLADSGSGITWGASLVLHGSWQMEVSRRDDPISLSGGQGDYDFAHWAKTLGPGDIYHAPPAWVTAVDEARDEDWLAALQGVEDVVRYREEQPVEEDTLPIIFNEWCSSWGNPTHEDVMAAGRIVADLGVTYFVIDDGWAEKPSDAFQFNGDWVVDTRSFPEGLKTTVQQLEDLGLVAGIWFEFECATEGTEAFTKGELQIKRHGRTLQVGNRHFWDFRNPGVWKLLKAKMTDLIRESGFKYLKIDYNESIGIGCDAEVAGDGIGEGLRSHLARVEEFLRELRGEIPGLTLECCSSGGHRLVPGLVGLSSMSSFSDAHETLEIPLIAANTHRIIPPHKNQIWAVIRHGDDRHRMEYSLASTFLGRMCLSGEVCLLNVDQLGCLREAIDLYKKVASIIRDGDSYCSRSISKTYRYPKGWQVHRRLSKDGRSLLIVAHSFENKSSTTPNIVLPPGDWELLDHFGAGGAEIVGDLLLITHEEDFSGSVCLFRKGAVGHEGLVP